MRLRSGKTLVKTVRPKNTSLPQNNASDTKQPIGLVVRTTENTNPIGTNELILTPVTIAKSMSGVLVTLHVATSIPTTHMPTHTPIEDTMPSYMPGFTMSLVSSDFLYGMPTANMERL